MKTAVKTCTYALTHFAGAVGVGYALTGDWRTAAAIGAVEPLVQTFAYAVHEKLWTHAG